MKTAAVIAASVAAAAASSGALNSKSDHYIALPSDSNKGSVSLKRKDGGSGSRRGAEGGKFAPRFDGLRFIETLVTAHR